MCNGTLDDDTIQPSTAVARAASKRNNESLELDVGCRARYGPKWGL